VFESVSKHDLAHDVVAKMTEYVAAGIPLIYIVYPKHRSCVASTADGSFRLLRGDARLTGGDVLPGFDVPLQAILPPPEMVAEDAAEREDVETN
jgi:Uma2 family endonuclease